MKRWILFILVVAPVVYLLTFGLSRDPRELPSVLIGKEAPAFSLKTLENKEITLESLRGSPIVMNFWATWCGPCLYEHAILKEARERFEKEGVKFLGVVYQDRREQVEAFLKEMGEPFVVLLDETSRSAIDFGVGGVPETFFIDSQGIVRKKLSGVLSREYIETGISEMQ
ncbi:MAG: DsbE family thiol:disulfide interchange protein [Deltaproteobacteria bacterium]|nr:DsbE family thiol:disulfide interchange protein [Deltaproteobacteria bacterium]MBI4223940.1 DsbE family thiol:disulfide interchange protein [Deltaproteobacteria bacterium]